MDARKVYMESIDKLRNHQTKKHRKGGNIHTEGKYTRTCIRRRSAHEGSYIRRDIHTDGYTRMNIHPKEHTQQKHTYGVKFTWRDIHTEVLTHGVIYTQRDIHTEGIYALNRLCRCSELSTWRPIYWMCRACLPLSSGNLRTGQPKSQSFIEQVGLIPIHSKCTLQSLHLAYLVAVEYTNSRPQLSN